MSVSSRHTVFDRVLIDLNTQCDFLLPRGAVPVANRHQMLPHVRALMNWARISRVPVISTIDSHRASEHNTGLPAYCVDRTPGQRKLPFTLLPRRIVLPGDNTLDIPIDALRRYRQVIFTKRCSDFLSNPKADRLINQVHSRYFIVFGVVTESCVKAAVLALMARQRRVVLVRDACGHWSDPDAELAIAQMEAKGATILKTDDLTSGREVLKTDETAGAKPAVHARGAAARSARSNGNGNGKPRHVGSGNGNGNGTRRANDTARAKGNDWLGRLPCPRFVESSPVRESDAESESTPTDESVAPVEIRRSRTSPDGP